MVYNSIHFGNITNFLKLAGGLPEKFLPLGHFCTNFKKVFFFEFPIMFRNFYALVQRILEKKASKYQPYSKRVLE